MEQIELLKAELIQIQENIERLEVYVQEKNEAGWWAMNCNVHGELKHRLVALKNRISIINKIGTSNLFNK